MDKSSLYLFRLSDRDRVHAYFVAIFTHSDLIRFFLFLSLINFPKTMHLGNLGCDESPED